jgi:hypothetical protein
LSPEVHQILAASKGLPPGFLSVAAITAEVVEKDITLQEGGDLAITAQTITGEPVSGALVDFPRSVAGPFRVRDLLRLGLLAASDGSLRTNAAGRLTVTSLPPGPLDLSVTGSGLHKSGSTQIKAGILNEVTITVE